MALAINVQPQSWGCKSYRDVMEWEHMCKWLVESLQFTSDDREELVSHFLASAHFHYEHCPMFCFRSPGRFWKLTVSLENVVQIRSCYLLVINVSFPKMDSPKQYVLKCSLCKKNCKRLEVLFLSITGWMNLEERPNASAIWPLGIFV